MSNIQLSSILDNDFYKITMQNAVVKLFPSQIVKYEFINRGKHFFPEGFADSLRHIVDKMAELKLTKEENDKVNELTATITDEKLRKNLKKLMVKNLAFNKIKVDNNWHKCLNCDTLCSKQEQYCTVCKIQRKAEKASKIRKLLIEAPWLTYAELNSYENCTSKEFINEKIILLN